MKDIIREGNPTLTAQAEPLSFPLDETYQKLAKDMIEFLINSQDEEIAEKYNLRAGVGLAAPQLDISKRMIALHVPDEEEEKSLSMVMINPKITRHSAKLVALKTGEGCLSVDRVVEGYVPRPKRITVEYYDLNGTKHLEKFKDYEAIVIQHEIDHINGILFYDHINADNPFTVTDNMELI